jgi:hypothetical protein
MGFWFGAHRLAVMSRPDAVTGCGPVDPIRPSSTAGRLFRDLIIIRPG